MGDEEQPKKIISRRWRSRVALMQHALRAIESSNRARESLDHVVRLLIEEENENVEIVDPASARGLPVAQEMTPPPGFNVTGDMFARTVRRRFEESTQESQRVICRDLVKKGRENGVITNEVADALEKDFSK